MASTRISAPMRGIPHQLTRLSIRPDALCSRCTKSICTPIARSISTTAPSKATVSSITTSITTSARGHAPVVPIEQQSVLATIHQFPSLEPLRFEKYPANHLYLPTRRDILHRAVVYEGDAARLGTASTKTRHEVRGSRRKVRPQKGTGRARLGDRMSPMLRGGGVAFGPKPRDFSSELPKKVYDLAWRTALSYRFRQGELIIVDNAMEIESPSAKLLGDIFKHHEKLRGRGRSLMVTLEERPLLEQALVEMDRGEQTLTWEEVDVKNLLELSRVIIERDALHNILLTHEEDLTHKSLQPWHKSLIRSSPPADLEATLGWSEFRELSLIDPNEKEKETARAETYEAVASTRYGYAESLPQSPKRTELTASALTLLAEAKEVRFAEKTGLSFADYLEVSEPARYPRVQAIDYQINVKSDLMNTAEETSRLQAEEILVEIRQLEEQRAELQHEAAILAAQVHEQRAEALRINGEAEIAEDVYAMAQGERTNVEVMELELLKAKLGTAEKKMDVAALRNDYAAQQKAKKEVSECSQLVQELEALRAAEMEMNDTDEAGWADVPESAEPPKVEAKEEKRV